MYIKLKMALTKALSRNRKKCHSGGEIPSVDFRNYSLISLGPLVLWNERWFLKQQMEFDSDQEQFNTFGQQPCGKNIPPVTLCLVIKYI